MAYNFPEERFQDVRAVIGQDINDAILPDEILALPTFKGEAERFIETYLTQAQIDDTNNTDKINTAAVYYLASIAAPTIPEVESERIPGGNITFVERNRNDQAITLRSKALDLVGEIDVGSGQPAVDTNPNTFTKAPRLYW